MPINALDPKGALTRPVKVEGKRVPLWQALYDASAWKSDSNDPREKASHDVTVELLKAYGLSLANRLDAAVDIARGAYGLYGVDLIPLAEIVRDKEVARWAAAQIVRLADKWDPKRGGTQATVPVFLALVRNDIALDPKWDAMIPVHSNKTPNVLIEIWRAVPETRRETILDRNLRAAYRAYETAALLAPALSSKACAKFLSENIDKFDTPPRATVKAIIEAIEGGSRAGKKIATLTLREANRFAPKSAADLTPIAKKQLLAAMLRYDEKSLSIKERLHDSDYEETGSVRNGLTRVELAGEAPVEGFLYMGDSGTFFAKGTTDVVAEMIQFGLEGGDPALLAALDAVLQRPEERAKKKPAAKRTKGR